MFIFRLIDYVHVGDLTLEEAQALVEKRLGDGGFVRSAHVTIFVDESASQGVTILGEVVKPGIYPSLGDRRLYDLISAAGGFSASAGRKVSIIRQHSSSGPITVNLPRNLADDLQDNVDIFPGDMITVPRAPIIYVVGDVGHPAGFLVDNGTLSVLQALALAGGTNHTAKMGGVRIIRKGPNGMTETKLPLKKMLEAKAPDINLQPDDILFYTFERDSCGGGADHAGWDIGGDGDRGDCGASVSLPAGSGCQVGSDSFGIQQAIKFSDVFLGSASPRKIADDIFPALPSEFFGQVTVLAQQADCICERAGIFRFDHQPGPRFLEDCPCLAIYAENHRAERMT